jgi:hypothetical protein
MQLKRDRGAGLSPLQRVFPNKPAIVQDAPFGLSVEAA